MAGPGSWRQPCTAAWARCIARGQRRHLVIPRDPLPSRPHHGRHFAFIVRAPGIGPWPLSRRR
eukprot:11156798-Lingulodinium_polyedra.AAC.1